MYSRFASISEATHLHSTICIVNCLVCSISQLHSSVLPAAKELTLVVPKNKRQVTRVVSRTAMKARPSEIHRGRERAVRTT